MLLKFGVLELEKGEAVNLPDMSCRQIKIAASAENQGRLWIGGEDVGPFTGWELGPGEESFWMEAKIARELFVVGECSGDKAHYAIRRS